MRAAFISEEGGGPWIGVRDQPVRNPDLSVIRVRAVCLNPVDIAVAGGRFYAGHPPFPYVPGLECVGEDESGNLVYCSGAGMGVASDGAAQELISVPHGLPIPLPHGSDPLVAAAVGTAGIAGWLATTSKGAAQPGDVVCVLGATGSVGRTALQAARAAGASRVIALGRDANKLQKIRHLADAAVDISADDAIARVRELTDGGCHLIIDTVWGTPLSNLATIMRPDGRIVHVGAAGGTSASLASDDVRGKRLSILGYSNFGVTRQQLVETYLMLLERARSGQLDLAVIEVPFDEIAIAWAGTRDGLGKFVISL